MYILLLYLIFFLFYKLIKLMNYIYSICQIIVIIQNTLITNIIIYNTFLSYPNIPFLDIDHDFLKQNYFIFSFNEYLLFI